MYVYRLNTNESSHNNVFRIPFFKDKTMLLIFSYSRQFSYLSSKHYNTLTCKKSFVSTYTFQCKYNKNNIELGQNFQTILYNQWKERYLKEAIMGLSVWNWLSWARGTLSPSTQLIFWRVLLPFVDKAAPDGVRAGVPQK